MPPGKLLNRSPFESAVERLQIRAKHSPSAFVASAIHSSRSLFIHQTEISEKSPGYICDTAVISSPVAVFTFYPQSAMSHKSPRILFKAPAAARSPRRSAGLHSLLHSAAARSPFFFFEPPRFLTPILFSRPCVFSLPAAAPLLSRVVCPHPPRPFQRQQRQEVLRLTFYCKPWVSVSPLFHHLAQFFFFSRTYISFPLYS